VGSATLIDLEKGRPWSRGGTKIFLVAGLTLAAFKPDLFSLFLEVA
jgi:hypothetical protein